MTKFSDRSVSEMVILAITGVVCVIVLGGALFIILVEVFHPGTDTSRVISLLADTINTLIGVMAGFLAGKTHSVSRTREPALNDA